MEKGSRPVRNRRHSRRAWPTATTDDIHNPIKRLFTPEIKRMLKDWLVRRRDNPYPSREEKKTLAIKTGLTYTQICNWFANWRRKLKNAGREPQKKTWGHLIKHYNTNAHGNVEQFSICSGDSIWGDEERNRYERNLMNSNFTNFEQQQSSMAIQNFNNTELINYSSSKISRRNQRYLQQQKQLRNEGRCFHKHKNLVNEQHKKSQHQQEQPPPPVSADITHQIHEVPFFNPNDYIIDNTLYLPSRKSNQAAIISSSTPLVMEQNDLYRHTNYNSASTVTNTNSFLYNKPMDDSDTNNGCFINNIQMRYNNQRNHRGIRHDDNDDDDNDDDGDGDDDHDDDDEDDIDGDDEDDGDEDDIGNRKTRNNNNNKNNGYFTNAKYKNHIMEKYLRGLDTSASSSQQSLLLNTVPMQSDKNGDNNTMMMMMMGFTETPAAAAAVIAGSPSSAADGGDGNNNVPELSKWLESTANFTPIKNNYIEWDSSHTFLKNRQQNKRDSSYLEDSFNDISLHQKEELDAAEALTSLAGNYRNKIMNNLITNNNNNINNISNNKLNFT